VRARDFYRRPADYDEAAFKNYLSALPDHALAELESLLEELNRTGDDCDIVAVAKAMYNRAWAELEKVLPAIPDDLIPYIPDDYIMFAVWGPDDIKHAVRLRNEAIGSARRRKELDDSLLSG
jgi:hypothetical protein